MNSFTVGVVYIVQNHKLYIGTGINSWKARHIAANAAVSITIPIAKRIPIMPWIRIPAATITFSGQARVLPANEVAKPILQAVFQGLADDAVKLSETCLIEVTPEKEFITYGIGIPLRQMRHPDQSRGRAPVA